VRRSARHVVCLICGYPSRLARGRWYDKEPEPAWNYALDQVVRNLLEKHGDIPLLAATRLASEKRSFLWAPELLIEPRDGNTAELDLCVILDGEVVIGEAKSNSRLKAGGKGTSKRRRTWSEWRSCSAPTRSCSRPQRLRGLVAWWQQSSRQSPPSGGSAQGPGWSRRPASVPRELHLCD